MVHFIHTYVAGQHQTCDSGLPLLDADVSRLQTGRYNRQLIVAPWLNMQSTHSTSNRTSKG